MQISTLEELRKNAIDENKEPVLMVEFEQTGRTYYVVEEFLFNLARRTLNE